MCNNMPHRNVINIIVIVLRNENIIGLKIALYIICLEVLAQHKVILLNVKGLLLNYILGITVTVN